MEPGKLLDRRNAVRDLLTCMFEGWRIREASWNAEEQRYMRSDEECMTEACDGDEQVGILLHLFEYWCNDIQSMSPYFGIECRRDSENRIYVASDIPPAPSPQHWWHNGAWEPMPQDDKAPVE